ncbi:putative antibiotic biosynthesis monooxygenase [Hyella patelloides LEGE 07179]|uniref:Putative antibiotic biosynthesis monooxygenase n=1 Tax=Hyella patelloides LEGE 07179 TaxID=945734 RepID=A0A563VY66_9CYAN|nr:antibiotic biosynthesis monooxygenase family protein [Hyella patelloides]VEP16398.1 putative antibiotic biosynthesis monooxygenase [Hyella patelloides LEGE 07179]
MTTLSLDNKLTTVIIIFTVETSQQDDLIAAIKEFLETVKTQPGFVSANLHKSTDGVKVANYAQWASTAEFEAFRNNVEIQKKAEKLFTFDRPDSHVYEIVTCESKVGTPEIKEGEYLTHFAEFSMKPENQPKMIELAKEHVKPAMEQPGLISATFHRSLDGTRVINYGQWSNQEAIEQLTKQPGFGKAAPYGEGIADNEYHLYEVVHVVKT